MPFDYKTEDRDVLQKMFDSNDLNSLQKREAHALGMLKSIFA